MFLVYSNTSNTVGVRLRELFELTLSKKITREHYERLRAETVYLGRRLTLLRSAQIAAGVTFLFNITTLLGIYTENQDIAQLLFACAVVSMMSSISLYLVEIIVTVKAVAYIVGKITENGQAEK
jgi:ABC-type multidrug transport system permease subunit